MKYSLIIICALILTSCGKKEKDLTVKGTIDGLKKGAIYLKKMNDSALVSVDSALVNGNSDFVLYSQLDSPEVFYLYLDKNSSEDDRIAFFADKGITEIKTSLKNFVFGAQIKGSKQQEIYAEYKDMLSKLNYQNLNLLEEQFEAQKNRDTVLADSIAKLRTKLLKRRYLYSANFAITHGSSEVAPYIALSEIYDAQYKLLDTINKSLTPKVKNSKYGIELERFLNEIQKNENNN